MQEGDTASIAVDCTINSYYCLSYCFWPTDPVLEFTTWHINLRPHFTLENLIHFLLKVWKPLRTCGLIILLSFVKTNAWKLFLLGRLRYLFHFWSGIIQNLWRSMASLQKSALRQIPSWWKVTIGISRFTTHRDDHVAFISIKYAI